MPVKPKPSETKEEFISRCISHEMNKNTDMLNDQAAAICYKYWDEEHMENAKYYKIKQYKNDK